MTRAYNTATTQQNSGGAVTPFAAGKNKIINGDFSIWQRGTSFTPMSNGTYGPDRWVFGLLGDVANVSRQAFTPNDIASIGYGDAQYFMRMEVVSSNGSARAEQKIEDVRTLANQSVTVSLWAKANTTTSLDLLFLQNFGSGGSSQITLDSQAVTLTTSWQRFSKTFTIPSVSGKTIGTGSYLAVALRENTASTNVTFDFWGVQVEAGSVATPFTTATGTIQGELAACQRYYQRWSWEASAADHVGNGQGSGGGQARRVNWSTNQTMRVRPSLSYSGTITLYDGTPNARALTSLGYASGTTPSHVSVDMNTSGGNLNLGDYIFALFSSGAFFEASSEL
jgi:hypothetical protein